MGNFGYFKLCENAKLTTKKDEYDKLKKLVKEKVTKKSAAKELLKIEVGLAKLILDPSPTSSNATYMPYMSKLNYEICLDTKI